MKQKLTIHIVVCILEKTQKSVNWKGLKKFARLKTNLRNFARCDDTTNKLGIKNFKHCDFPNCNLKSQLALGLLQTGSLGLPCFRRPFHYVVNTYYVRRKRYANMSHFFPRKKSLHAEQFLRFCVFPQKEEEGEKNLPRRKFREALFSSPPPFPDNYSEGVAKKGEKGCLAPLPPPPPPPPSGPLWASKGSLPSQEESAGWRKVSCSLRCRCHARRSGCAAVLFDFDLRSQSHLPQVIGTTPKASLSFLDLKKKY